MQDAIMAIVSSAIAELNEELEYDNLRTVSPDTPLFGDVDGIDSISLARLISEIETRIGEDLERQVVLADEKAMSMRNSPYRTVGTLLAFIQERLEDGNG